MATKKQKRRRFTPEYKMEVVGLLSLNRRLTYKMRSHGVRQEESAREP